MANNNPVFNGILIGLVIILVITGIVLMIKSLVGGKGDSMTTNKDLTFTDNSGNSFYLNNTQDGSLYELTTVKTNTSTPLPSVQLIVKDKDYNVYNMTTKIGSDTYYLCVGISTIPDSKYCRITVGFVNEKSADSDTYADLKFKKSNGAYKIDVSSDKNIQISNTTCSTSGANGSLSLSSNTIIVNGAKSLFKLIEKQQ